MKKKDKKTNAAQHGLINRVVRQTQSQAKRDIADWRDAIRQTKLVQNPKFYLLQDLYEMIEEDTMLSSQVANRIEQTVSAPFELIDGKDAVNDDQTKRLAELPCIMDIIRGILESNSHGYTIQELERVGDSIVLYDIPRRNIDPINGRFFPTASYDQFIYYRELPEFGKNILEFNSDTLGYYNKAVPHVLFKKFAQSCWSELCEIFGIPPRYIKTTTSDPAMLSRAEHMLREMGSAAAFVIDSTEEFAFAQGVSTNGDVYGNLIKLCNQEMSMLISGAIIGQDTENGNRSKEEVSVGLLDRLVEADHRLVESHMNSTVLPALIELGYLSAEGLRFRFSSVEDTEKLWAMVKDIIPYKDIDDKWMTEKFGIPVSTKAMPASLSALHRLTGGDPDFFN